MMLTKESRARGEWCLFPLEKGCRPDVCNAMHCMPGYMNTFAFDLGCIDTHAKTRKSQGSIDRRGTAEREL